MSTVEILDDNDSSGIEMRSLDGLIYRVHPRTVAAALIRGWTRYAPNTPAPPSPQGSGERLREPAPLPNPSPNKEGVEKVREAREWDLVYRPGTNPLNGGFKVRPCWEMKRGESAWPFKDGEYIRLREVLPGPAQPVEAGDLEAEVAAMAEKFVNATDERGRGIHDAAFEILCRIHARRLRGAPTTKGGGE